jgi:hypothetical protein
VYAVLGEHDSDARTLRVLILRLAKNDRLPVKPWGFGGGPSLLKGGARQLNTFYDLHYRRFVIAYDSDGHDPEARRAEVIQRIIEPSVVVEGHCVIVPVQEIEAWILADLTAVTKVFSSWRPNQIEGNPEAINSPKEYLKRLSRDSNKRPRYDPGTHNERVAKFLDFNVLRQRCPSFRPLSEFVTGA